MLKSMDGGNVWMIERSQQLGLTLAKRASRSGSPLKMSGSTLMAT
jgi:hypothetical protein